MRDGAGEAGGRHQRGGPSAMRGTARGNRRRALVWTRLSAVSCALLVGAAPTWAQSPASTTQDTLVRVTLDAEDRVQGVLRSSLATDPLRIERRGHILEIRAEDIQRIELGARRTSGQGFVRGAGIGALITSLSATLLWVADTGLDPDYGGAGGIPIVAAYFALPGAVIGGVIGAAAPGVRWVTFTEADAAIGFDVDPRGAIDVSIRVRVW